MGGAEHSLLDVLAFTRERCECHLVTTEDGTLVERARAMGVKCHIVPCDRTLSAVRRWHLIRTLLVNRRALLSFAGYLLRLRKFLAMLEPDLVHANVPKSHAALVALGWIGWHGPCCYHIREIFPPRSASRLLYGLARRRTTKVIAISHAVKRALPGWLGDRAVVIHNGIAVPVDATRRESGRYLRMLYLGRVVPWKGCHHLIDMAVKLAARYGEQRFRLDIVGGSLYWPEEYRNELDARLRAGKWTGFCRLFPHTRDPAADYGRHDLFCNASYREPFGRTVAEAQAHGLPVVSFDTGGIGEIVEHGSTGLLAPEGDVDALVDAAGRFIDDPALVSKMGERGRQRARRLFDRDVQGPRLAGVLAEWATRGET